MAEQHAASRESERNFLLSVSHELKTPLTAIRGYAEGLGEGAFSSDDAARTILLESRRLERLVRDLLDLARMNRHEFSVSREVVDLGEVAREAVALYEAHAREFGVTITAEGGDAWVEGDHDRLLQVASNLVENALRETPPSGFVVVRVEPRTDSRCPTRARVSSCSDLDHAFDRFFLYDKYGRERPVGSGLGLAIVKQLTEAMGGTVEVEVVARGSATFVVTLPSAREWPPPSRSRSLRSPDESRPSCYGRSFEVSTTSKSAPVRRPRVCRSSFDQRASGAPLMYQGEPLSARIIPVLLER